MDLTTYVYPDKADLKNPIELFRAFGFFVPQEQFGAVRKEFPEHLVARMNLVFRMYEGYTRKILIAECESLMESIKVLEANGSHDPAVGVINTTAQRIARVLEHLTQIELFAEQYSFGPRIQKRPTTTMGDLLREAMSKQDE